MSTARDFRAAMVPTDPLLNLGPHLPSIEALGRHIHAVECERARLMALKNEPETQRSEDLLWDRSQAVRALITTMRPGTIADAAVSAHVAGEIVADICSNDHTDVEARMLAHQAERMILAVASALAKTAGLDFGDFFEHQICNSRFEALEPHA